MAIFSKKDNTETVDATATVVTESTVDRDITLDAKASRSLIVPRISEKAGKMNAMNKYVFTAWGKTNKIEARKTIESVYGVKVANVNMITVDGKARRFGRRTGVTQKYKKVIVTLTPDSKKIDLVEPS